jgi:LPS-assembly protein
MARLSAMVMGLACVLAAEAATAQQAVTFTANENSPVTRTTLPKQDANAPVAVSADHMAVDQESQLFVAKGKVEVMQGDMIINADRITYYQAQDLVIAEGNVSLLQPSGDVFFSDRAELKDGMKRAIINEFQARLMDGSILVAEKAIKPNSKVTKLSYASYTPCKICPGSAPFWQMNAEYAELDEIEEQVTYHNAFMEMFGVPVLYTPYLSHPSPEARGKSGFLTPSYTTNPYFGALAKVPYYWRMGEDRDMLVTPWFTANEGPLLETSYNQLRDEGTYRAHGSMTYPNQRDAAGNQVSGNELRWHLFAQGDERVSENTHAGFDIQRASDDTYLRRYGYSGQQALFSRAYLEQAEGRNFLLTEGLAIQGLRDADDSRRTPQVFPMLRGYYETAPLDSGVTLNLAGDAQWLTRREGVDQARLSLTPGMTLPLRTSGGHVLTSTLRVRQDIYHSSDVPRSGAPTFDGTTTRTMPQAGLEWRYPLVNNAADGQWVVEPIALGVAQPNGKNPDEISNEDSRLLELTDTNLFSLDRIPGLDLYDSGSRVAYGMRAHYLDTTGIAVDGMLGQNYNFDSDTPFPNSNRPDNAFSDYIGRLGLQVSPLSLAYRFAVDREEVAFNRNEVTASFSQPWLSVSGTVLSIKNNQYLPDSSEAIVSGSLPLNEEWSLYGGARRDLELDLMVMANSGLIYKNECFNIIVDALRLYTRDRDIEPTTEFTFRVAFKNLGEFGGR